MTVKSHSLAIEFAPLGTKPASPMLQIVAPATGRPRVMEIVVNFISSQSSTITFGLGRPATQGTPATGRSQVLKPEGPADADSLVTLVNEWAVPPTAPTNFFRRYTFRQLAAQCYTEMQFERGLLIPVSSSLILWVISVTATADAAVPTEAWVVVEE